MSQEHLPCEPVRIPFPSELDSSERIRKLTQLVIILKKKHEAALRALDDLRSSKLQQSDSASEEDLKLLKTAYEQLKTFKATNEHLLKENQQYQDRYAALEMDFIKLQRELKQNSFEQELEEVNAQLKQAQQHLAKKVRENTVLTENLELEKRHVDELQHQLENARARIEDCQQIIENQKSLEAKIKEWEQKYFEMYAQWKKSDEKNRELHGIEDQYRQVKIVIKNLSDLIGDHSA